MERWEGRSEIAIEKGRRLVARNAVPWLERSAQHGLHLSCACEVGVFFEGSHLSINRVDG